MEQQYHRLPLVPSDIETPDDLEKDANSISSELCVRCRTQISKANSINPWKICLALTFGLLVSIVLGIWVWNEVLSPRSVVPDSKSISHVLGFTKLMNGVISSYNRAEDIQIVHAR